MAVGFVTVGLTTVGLMKVGLMRVGLVIVGVVTVGGRDSLDDRQTTLVITFNNLYCLQYCT